jgi:quinol monooxygenase YgiN
MKILVVHIKVKPEMVEDFITASLDNARNSIQERGVAQFDFLQDESEPTRFTLYEAYYDESGVEAHRVSAHYQRWKLIVEPMMDGPRQGLWHHGLQHQDKAWSRA